MKVKFIGSLLVLTITSVAMADFKLANSGKTVLCYAEDNQDWVLNSKRTAIKYTVEGESLGPKKILKRDSDGSTFVSYTTSEGTLTLGDQGDTYLFNGDSDPSPIHCK